MASITVLADVIVPNSLISAGVRGKRIRANQRVPVASGQMQVNIGPQTVTKRQFSVGTVPLTVDEFATLDGLFEVTEAGAYGCLLFDPTDSIVTLATGGATLLDAGTHTYQLHQIKTSAGSARTKNRRITRPRATGFVLAISGTPTGSYTLDDETGIVTIPADPAAASVTWSGRFYVPVHFASDELDWDLVIAGPADTRYMAGPAVVLDEVIE